MKYNLMDGKKTMSEVTSKTEAVKFLLESGRALKVNESIVINESDKTMSIQTMTARVD